MTLRPYKGARFAPNFCIPTPSHPPDIPLSKFSPPNHRSAGGAGNGYQLSKTAHKGRERKQIIQPIEYSCLSLDFSPGERIIATRSQDFSRGTVRLRRKNDLGKDPMPSLLLRLAIPTMLAQLINVLYSIVDRMFIGHMKAWAVWPLRGWGCAALSSPS